MIGVSLTVFFSLVETRSQVFLSDFPHFPIIIGFVTICHFAEQMLQRGPEPLEKGINCAVYNKLVMLKRSGILLWMFLEGKVAIVNIF